MPVWLRPWAPHLRCDCMCVCVRAPQMMALEPERRIDPDAALRHPFVKDFLPRKEPHGKGKKGTAAADG